MKEILKVKDLSVNNNSVKILKNISFNIKKGEILGIVGESGCGKSTLIRALIQMMNKSEKITNGEILFNEKNLLLLDNKQIRKLRGNNLAVIFQNPGATLNPIRKIGKQFVQTMQSHMNINKNEALEKAANMLEKVNLKDSKCILNSYPFELSGGMKQRVTIALAMILEPEILIADEPTSALDVTVQAQVVKEMMSLRDNFQTSIIIVTHSMSVISQMVDKVAVMYSGNIVEYGDKEDILRNPKHPYTKALIDAVPKMDGTMPKGIKGNPPLFTENITGCSFAPRCEKCNEVCIKNQQYLKKMHDGRYIACDYVEDVEKKILQCNNLRKTYKKKDHLHVACDDINLYIKQGECLGVVGESGSGKSTLANIIMKLEKADSGTVILNDKDITNVKRNELKEVYKEIQMVFQDAIGSFNPRLTIEESIMEYVCNLCSTTEEEKKHKVDNLLRMVGLSKEYKYRYPHELSGGQCQRAAIARALSAQPKILVCDEATSALDVSVQAQIVELLKEMQEKMNISYLFITHDLALVSSFCDRVAVMKNGKVVEVGDAKEVINNPMDEYTKLLIKSAYF